MLCLNWIRIIVSSLWIPMATLFHYRISIYRSSSSYSSSKKEIKKILNKTKKEKQLQSEYFLSNRNIYKSLGVTYLTGISRSSLCKLTKGEDISTVFISREKKAATEILSLSKILHKKWQRKWFNMVKEWLETRPLAYKQPFQIEDQDAWECSWRWQ